MSRHFARFANWASDELGRAHIFILALAVIVVWAVTGPIFGFSDTWQLVINTGTTIVTFLMVFLIQNTQNREAIATQIKLDELLRAIAGARGALADAEERDEKDLKKLRTELVKAASESEEVEVSAVVEENGATAPKR
jgi:low affinity Fe/Cu permease